MVHKHTLDLRHLIRQCPECSRRFSRDAVFCPFDGGRLADATRPDDALDPLIAKTIDGRYAIESVLGEGGMGTVYAARHVTLGRALALKVLRADLAKETDLAARFIQEAQATAAIKHPNIVAITDFGRLPDARPYFVMELLSGRTLAALLKAGGALPPRQAAQIAIAIAQGLEAAHAAGVVHRDLKPENIFLQGDEGKEVRVVDFGAAMVIGASRLTKQGVVFGTPFYMSPEQAAGAKVDHRADIYALGIILYEMITGRVPFEGDTYMGVLTQHMFVAPRPPSELMPDGRKLGAVEDVVLRALEKDPTARFATMADFATAIEQALEARGVIPSWPSPVRASVAPKPRGIADELELPTTAEIRDHANANERMERRGRLQKVVGAAVGACVALVVVGVGAHMYSANKSAPVTAATATTSPSVTPGSPAPPDGDLQVSTLTAHPTNIAVPPPQTASVAPPQTTTTKTISRPQPTHTTQPTLNTLGPDPFEKR